jgi:erythromycin esterase
MKSLIFLLFFTHLTCLSQNKINSTSLNYLSPAAETSDLSRLDSLFTNRKIIGIGESTHGTSEFTTMRHRLFKYLVENHGYNTFFLEADVGACRRINRYIHGASDSLLPAMNEIKLWPWLTEEMAALVNWMRAYNSNDKNINKIDFIGCDMQLIKDDQIELSRLYRQNSDTLFEHQSLDFEFDKSDSVALLNGFETWKILKSQNATLDIKTDKLLVQSIDQWFERELTTSYKGNFRDSCMAANMNSYLENNPNSKGFYFAHNWHVSKTNRANSNDLPNTKTTGYYLFEKLESNYYCIAQDFYSGSFNAINYVENEFRMETFKFNSSKRKSIAYQIVKSKSSDKQFVSSDYLPHINKLSMTFIGAIYGKSKSGHKIYRYRPINRADVYDAFIVIKETAATRLLK